MDWEIIKEADAVHAFNDKQRLIVSDGGRAFKRRAIKGVGSLLAREVTWLVGELDGVRVYIDGDRLVMTKQDLYP